MVHVFINLSHRPSGSYLNDTPNILQEDNQQMK